MSADRHQQELSVVQPMLDGIVRRRQSLSRFKAQLSSGGIDPVTAVLSDPHGNLLRFQQLLGMTELDSVDHIVLLGDYMDRGLHGVSLFAEVRDLVESGRAVALLGNHEQYVIRTFLGAGSEGGLFDWIANGGLAVLDERGLLADRVNATHVQIAARVAIRHSPGAELDYFNGQLQGLLEELLEVARADSHLQEIARWYQQNLDLYRLDDNGNLFVHAGVPVNNYGDVQLQYKGKRGLAALDRAQVDLRSADEPTDEVFRFLGGEHSILALRRNDWVTRILRYGWANRVLDQLGVDRIFFGHTSHDGELFDLDGFAYCLDRSFYANQGCCFLIRPDGFGVYDFPDPNAVDPVHRTIASTPALLVMVDEELRQLDLRQSDLKGRRRVLEGTALGLAAAITPATGKRLPAVAGSDESVDYPYWADIDVGRAVREVAEALADDGTIPRLKDRERYETVGIDQVLRIHYLRRFNQSAADALQSVLVELLKNAYEEAPDGVITIRLSPTGRATWTLSVENEGAFGHSAQKQLLNMLLDHVKRGQLSVCYSIDDLSVKPESRLSRFFTPIRDYEEAFGFIEHFVQERGLESLIFIHGLGREKSRPGDELGRGGVGLTGVFWTVTAKFGGSVGIDHGKDERTVLKINLCADALDRSALLDLA